MLKIVVYDGGMGGELFADYLARELPIVEIIRAIDWRNAEMVLTDARKARKAAEETLRPYIGKVDLIVLANHLLTMTSLKYFRKKYACQKFVGLELPRAEQGKEARLLVLTTPAVARTWQYKTFLLRRRQKTMTIALADLVRKIDEARFPQSVIEKEIVGVTTKKGFNPKGVILLNSHFSALCYPLKKNYGARLKIYDSYFDTLHEIYRALDMKGWIKKKK